MIKIHIQSPPLGISEVQEFKTPGEVSDFFFLNKDRLPFMSYEDGVVKYGRELYEKNNPDEVNKVLEKISVSHAVDTINSVIRDLRKNTENQPKHKPSYKLPEKESLIKRFFAWLKNLFTHEKV